MEITEKERKRFEDRFMRKLGPLFEMPIEEARMKIREFFEELAKEEMPYRYGVTVEIEER